MEYLFEIVAIILIILIPIIAQIKIKTTYSKWSKIDNGQNITGEKAARMILDRNGLSSVSIGKISGDLTDHYDPRTKTVNLSSNIHDNTSVASVAVAAHECGHAIQDKEAYAFLRFRSSMVPIVNISAKLSSIFIIIGFITQILNIVYIGIILLSVGLLFQLVTLPVEFDASKRGKEELKKCGLVDNKNVKGAKSVLKAAAYTYVAGFLATALQIVRLVLLTRRRN